MTSTSVDQVAAVCYRRRDGQIEFLLVRSDGGRWIFPKGKIEVGESLPRASQREAHEEAGVSGQINSQAFTIFKHLKRGMKKKGIELNVAAFLLKVGTVYPPQEEGREPTWFTPEKAKGALSGDRDFEYAEEYRRVVDEACSLIGNAPLANEEIATHDASGENLHVFVSYSHQDAKYLKNDSLLGFLSGLTREGFDFWHDERIIASETWDERIRIEMEKADIALVLVSQAFLNSRYCQEVEVTSFIRDRSQSGLKIFPIILAPCDWKSHDWLASTQFQPRSGRTIGTHYKDKAKREALYLEILEELRKLKREIQR